MWRKENGGQGALIEEEEDKNETFHNFMSLEVLDMKLLLLVEVPTSRASTKSKN